MLRFETSALEMAAQGFGPDGWVDPRAYSITALRSFYCIAHIEAVECFQPLTFTARWYEYTCIIGVCRVYC